MQVAIEREVSAAFAFAEASPPPEGERAYADLYAEAPRVQLERRRA